MRPKTHKIKASGVCPTDDRSEIKAGGHNIITDEPVERGGSDLGPSPLETLMASLVGCTNVISHRIAKEMDIVLELEKVEVVGDLDMAVLSGDEPPVVFPDIALDVKARSDASAQQLGELRSQLAKRCPVSLMMRQAGSRINENWQVETLPPQSS